MTKKPITQRQRYVPAPLEVARDLTEVAPRPRDYSPETHPELDRHWEELNALEEREAELESAAHELGRVIEEATERLRVVRDQQAKHAWRRLRLLQSAISRKSAQLAREDPR